MTTGLLRPDDLRPALDAVLLAWREAFGRRGWVTVPYDLRVNGAELLLEVHAWGASRTVRGRLSAFGTLAGRFWAAAAFEPEAHRLCPAWLPTLDDGGLARVVRSSGVADALRVAAVQFLAAGEEDEAALCLARSAQHSLHPEAVPARLQVRLRHDGVPRDRPPEALLARLKRPDPVERLAVAVACEEALRAREPQSVLEGFRPFRDPLRALLADVQPALHERGLALLEWWALALVRRGAYRESLPLLDTLEEGSVRLGEVLRGRYEARLAVGDRAGARNDWARLSALRLRVPPLDEAVPLDGDLAGDHDDAQVLALTRAARAHLAWAAGADPCPDRKVSGNRPARAAQQAQLASARSRLDEALAVLEPRLAGLSPALCRLHAGTYEALARLREQSGDPQGARAARGRHQELRRRG